MTQSPVPAPVPAPAAVWPSVLPWPPTDAVVAHLTDAGVERGYRPYVPQRRFMGRPLFLLPDITMALMLWLSGNMPGVDFTHQARRV